MASRERRMHLPPSVMGAATNEDQENVAAATSIASRVGQQIFSDYYTTRDKAWAIAGGVGVGAVFGVLTRIGLSSLSSPYVDPPGSTGRDGEVVQEIVANMAGCFAMGIAVELRSSIQPFHPTIYAALTTGFCGCCTTFSSFNTAVVLIALRSSHLSLGIGCAIVALTIGAATAWCSLQAGRFVARQPPPQLIANVGAAHEKLASVLAAPGSKKEDVERALGRMSDVMAELQSSGPALIETLHEHELPAKWIRRKLIFYWCCLIAGVIFLIIHVINNGSNLTPLAVSVSVAPLGAWLRYTVGFQNQHHRIPYYTLLCNLVACIGSAYLSFLLDPSCNTAPPRASWFAVFKGLSVGFCGSLSTVSTFVDEVRRLGNQHRGHAIFYALLTVLGGLALGIGALSPFYSRYACWNPPK